MSINPKQLEQKAKALQKEFAEAQGLAAHHEKKMREHQKLMLEAAQRMDTVSAQYNLLQELRGKPEKK